MKVLYLAHLLTGLCDLFPVAPCRCQYFERREPPSWFCTEGLLLSGFHWTSVGCHLCEQDSLAQHQDRPSAARGNGRWIHIRYLTIVKAKIFFSVVLQAFTCNIYHVYLVSIWLQLHAVYNLSLQWDVSSCNCSWRKSSLTFHKS